MTKSQYLGSEAYGKVQRADDFCFKPEISNTIFCVTLL